MKTLYNYITEKANFLVKKHLSKSTIQIENLYDFIFSRNEINKFTNISLVEATITKNNNTILVNRPMITLYNFDDYPDYIIYPTNGQADISYNIMKELFNYLTNKKSDIIINKSTLGDDVINCKLHNTKLCSVCILSKNDFKEFKVTKNI